MKGMRVTNLVNTDRRCTKVEKEAVTVFIVAGVVETIKIMFVFQEVLWSR